jgi:enoyl-CoA hydratase
MARELIYSGRIVNAEEALRIGLLNAVVPRADLMTRVRVVAAEIASMSPTAVMHAKRAMNEGEALSLEKAVALEATANSRCDEPDDQRAGMSAFLEKRKPVIGKRLK